MFHIAVWLILLIVVIIENKEPKINDFGAIFGGIDFTQTLAWPAWDPDGKQLLNLTTQ